MRNEQFPAIGMHLAQTACTRHLKKHVLLQFRVVDVHCAWVVDLKRAFYYSLSDRGAFRARGLPATVPDSKARVLLELHHPHTFHAYGLRETVASEQAQNFFEQEVSVEGWTPFWNKHSSSTLCCLLYSTAFLSLFLYHGSIPSNGCVFL